MELEYKSVDLTQFKFDDASHGGNGGFTGYASTFGNVDSYGDIVRPGAYTECLKDFVRDGWLAIGHEWGALGAGFFTEAKEDAHGLLVDAVFHSTLDGKNARTVVRERLDAGKSVATSIGYRVPKGGRVENDDGTFDLVKIDLKEISIVPCPANGLALITGAKSGPRGGMTLAAHSDAVLAAVEELVARFTAVGGMRAKEGRRLSAATVSHIERCSESIDDTVSGLVDVRAELADLLAATEPKPKGESEPDTLSATRQVYAEFLRSMSA